MKKHLEKQSTFNLGLKFLALLAKWKVTETLIPFFTTLLAEINLKLNKPNISENIEELANSWLKVMPPDGQHHFKKIKITDDIAYMEIHLNYPLRNSGNMTACNNFMNYDRSILKSIGGSLTVLESQANSGKNYCSVAIKRLNDTSGDLIQDQAK
ncbi:MAG: hypothetical protein KDC92_12545 [Bacteroidetes bacterium]|nr:hypothetical protein [Bacteroidota bacterium]